jgi:hypothetical protein
VRSTRAWEMRAMQRPHLRRPENVVARVAAREPGNESCSDQRKENAEMEKSRLWTRSLGYRRAVGDGSASYKRDREAEYEQD